jgi:SAM-dependent methyltransferase
MQHEDAIKAIREDYDRIADEYAQRVYPELKGKPLDRDLLRRLAESIGGRGSVCDLGCGPAQVARFLRDSGVEVFGLDNSPGMLEAARRLNPDIDFREGNILALPLRDNELSGIAAFYSIVNLLPEWLTTAFAEMHRVLAPGGLLLLAFHAGDQTIRPEELFGQPISMEFYYFPPAVVRTQLMQAGFEIEDMVVRRPYAPEVEHQSERAYIFARKAKEVAV